MLEVCVCAIISKQLLNYLGRFQMFILLSTGNSKMYNLPDEPFTRQFYFVHSVGPFK